VFVVVPFVKDIVLFIFNDVEFVGGYVIDGVLFTVVKISLNNKLFVPFENCCELIVNVLGIVESLITI
jgi:hypothetical protein